MYFEELSIGQKFPGTTVTVTEAHIVNFGAITGDWGPLHFNEEVAAKSVFGKRIGHGMLTASLAMSSVVPIMGNEAATHLSDDFTYKDPVLIGDTITTECEVLELQPKSKWGLVRLKLVVRNQHGRAVLEGATALGFHYRAKPAADQA